MSFQFLASPPKPVWRISGLRKHVWRMCRSIGVIVRQVFLPFEPQPGKIDPIPEPAIELTEAHVRQCQWIFDQAEARRIQLEQKAQSAFGLMVFLVPLLASLFVFLISKGITHTTSGRLAVALLGLSAILVLLGFISIVRAISVKNAETLFLGAVIDLKDGQFREYNSAFHARGLLYCASMNTGMNDHIAQFTKGGQILTAAAVIAVTAAAVLATVAFSGLAPSATEAKIVGQVNVSSAELTGLREEVANLRKVIAALANGKTAEEGLKSPKASAPTLESNGRRPTKEATGGGPRKK